MTTLRGFYLRHNTLMGTCCSLGADVPEVLVRSDASVDSALHVYVPALAYVTAVILARVFK